MDTYTYGIKYNMQTLCYYYNQLFDFWGIRLLFGAAVSVILTFFNADEIVYYSLMSLLILDFITGWVASIKNGSHDMCIFNRGILKFVSFSLYIGVVGIFGVIIYRSTGYKLPLLDIFMGYLAIGEVLSILDNSVKLGFKPPGILYKLLYRGKNNIETFLENKVDSIIKTESRHYEETNTEENTDRP